MSEVRRPGAGNLLMQRAAILIIPVLLFCLSQVLKGYYGPYFLGYHSDPEYAYLLNALNITHFITPGHTDHPGTTLQLLGAAVLLFKWLMHQATGGHLGINELVLRHPEESLAAINLAINVLVLLAFVFASLAIYRSMRSIGAVLVFQLSLLVPLQVKFCLVRAYPEPLLVFSLLILSGLLVRYHDPECKAHCRAPLPLLIGITLGFGVATKVTFLPVLLFVALFPGNRERLTALSACVMSFLFFTLPITSKFPQMLYWFGSLAVHQGRYGSGAVGVPPIAALMGNVWQLIQAEPSLFVFLLCYLSYLIVCRFRAERGANESTNRMLLLGAGLIVIQVLMTAKHPAAHYLVPAVTMTALLNAKLVESLRRDCAVTTGPLRKGLACFMVIGALLYVSGSIKTWASASEAYRDKEAAMSSRINAINGCTPILYYRASSIEYALAFGDDFSAMAYSKQLSEIYPDRLFYNIWTGSFYNYLSVVNSVEVFNRNRCLLLVGVPLQPNECKKGNLRLTPLVETPITNIYKLEGLTL